MLECSHMTSTNQSQPDAKFVTEQEKEKEEEEQLHFKSGITVKLADIVTL